MVYVELCALWRIQLKSLATWPLEWGCLYPQVPANYFDVKNQGKTGFDSDPSMVRNYGQRVGRSYLITVLASYAGMNTILSQWVIFGV